MFFPFVFPGNLINNRGIYFIILLLIANLFISCNDESNILTPNYDNELQKQLVGTWQMQNGTRTLIYRSDFTFIDSSNSFTAQGTYSIEDSILYKSNITIRYIDSSQFYQFLGHNFYFPSNYLKFSNNSMTEIPVRVFETNDRNNSELWGSWSRIVWIYRLRFSEPSYLGRVKTTINFDEIYKKACWWSENIDITSNNSDTLCSNNVKYEPPILDITGTGDYFVEVRFKDNKMYLWELYEPTKYNRLN